MAARSFRERGGDSSGIGTVFVSLATNEPSCQPLSRSVSANAAGASGAAHSRPVGLWSATPRTEAGRAWRKKRKEASHRGHGKKAGGVTATHVGERRRVRPI